MSPEPRTLRLPSGLLILCASILVMLWGALIFDARRSEQSAIEQASRDVRNLTMAFREHIHRTASAIDQLMVTMMAAQADAGDVYRLPQWIDSSPLLQGMALQVGVIGPDGIVRASNLGVEGRVDLSDRRHFRHHLDPAATQPHISVPVRGRVSGKWSIQFTRRITGSDGSFRGVVVISVDPKYFSDFFDSVDLGRNGVAMLVGRDGIMRARRPAETEALGQDVGSTSLFQRLRLADTGTYRATSPVDGVERVFGYSTVPGYPLVVGAGMGLDDVLAASRHQQGTYLVIGGALSVIVIALTWFLVRESERRRRRDMAVHAEKKLFEQKQLLDAALNNMRDGLVMMDKDNQVVVVNQRYIDMYGLSPAMAKAGCHLRDLLQQRAAVGNFAGDIDHYIENVIVNGRAEHVVVDLPDGRAISIGNRRMPDGGTVSTHQDITAQRQAEQAAAAAEEEARAAHRRLLDAFEVVPEGIALFDAEDRYVLCNRRYLELYPETAPQIQMGRRFEDVMREGVALGQYPDAKGREEEWVAGRLALHRNMHSAHEQHLPGDRWLRVEERRTADGGSIGVRIDITDLKQREASFRLLFEGNPLPMFVYDLESLEFLAVNEAAVRQFGHGREQFLALRVDDIWAAADRDRHLAEIRQWGDDHTEESWHYRRSDGTFFEASAYSRALRYQGRPTRFVAVIDLTDRRRAERDRDRNRDLLDRIIEGVPTAIFVKAAREQRFLMTNSAGEKLFGMPRGEIIGRTAHELLPKATAAMVEEHDRALLRLESPLFIPDHAMLTPRNGERTVTLKRLSIRDQNGDPEYLLTFIDDLTDRKAVEAQLRQAQKMEAVGNMTGGLAHDFNNLLTVIIGNLDLLRDDVAGSPAAEQKLETILGASERGADLTRQMLAFSRRQPLRSKPLDVNALIDKTMRLLKRTLGETVTINLHLSTDLPTAVVDEAQLETALVNIALNGRDAMPEGGTLTLETQCAHLDASYAALHPEVAAGEYACIAITDTGQGMPANVIERIFEPFFTTKGDGNGTGLGLSMVYGFIKQSGGHISVYSEIGRGTTFKLFLPVARMASARALPTNGRDAAQGGGEIILAVDDNPHVRATVVHQLRALGYGVREADGARAALDILDSGEKIDLLFTDIVMPGGVNGKELAIKARYKRPDLKVLFTSGFTGKSLANGGELEPCDTLLSKPYRNHELAKVLHKILNAAR